MIVVATADFELYHGVVTELRDRGVTFTTIEPDEELPERTEAVVVGPEETIDVPDDVAVVEADPAEPRRAVEDLLAIMRGEGGRIVVGVDPGEKPGIAVLAGDVVIGAFQVPPDQVGEVVRREVEDATDPLVRIGDGARLVGSRIVDALEDVPVEVVDETGTTPYLGTGARGMGDVLAAVNIARIEGERVDSIDIDPTTGELDRIKERSREESETNRAIDEHLARRVAAGELTIEEALAEHQVGKD
ncbi:hypothetical protein [Halorhabdus sp. BNX81]|uniref:hypothetical protein n=1 Tax=Halorhabdus sp. BNX81 TaxID=2980181 RepID=UPI0023DD4FE0|nr:hypothetical protein [Halorhabdus sp. BNX81]WEL20773.1 Conserved hypothetical protein [Halorhabdus sp. BNX81]